MVDPETSSGSVRAFKTESDPMLKFDKFLSVFEEHGKDENLTEDQSIPDAVVVAASREYFRLLRSGDIELVLDYMNTLNDDTKVRVDCLVDEYISIILGFNGFSQNGHD